MSTHKLAILVSAVGAAKAAKDLKGVDAAISNIGARAGKGVRTAASNMLKLGAAGAAVGAGLVAVNVKSGVQSLATLESAVSQVQGALVNMGYAGQVTGGQVAKWSDEIERSIGSAFDDKDITGASAALIRYGKVAPSNLRRAMVVMTDMAAKSKDVGQSGVALSKALADPIRSVGILRKAGVVLNDEQIKTLKGFGNLTKAQQKHYVALLKTDKGAAARYRQGILDRRQVKAQAYLLAELEKTTKGAAEASQGEYARAMATMGDATEDAQRALAIGFLPVIKRAADWIKGVLADPTTLNNIKTFGTNLAGAFDKVLSFAQGIPWDKVTNGLKTAADWAGKLFGAFTSMPPEVQGTILALAGLEKLSGGAVSGIVGELGKGLVKGVLGMNAAVVNLKAGVVNGGGGGGLPGGGGGAAAGAGGLTGLLSTAAAGASIVGGMLLAKEALLTWVPTAIGTQKGGDEAGKIRGAYGGTRGGQNVASYTEAQIGALLRNVPGNVSPSQKPVTANDSKAHSQQIAKAVDVSRADTRTELNANRRETAGVSVATRVGAASNVIAQAAAASRIVGAVQSAGRPTVNVYVNVPGANVRYGSSSGSSGTSGGGNRTSKPE